MDFKLKTSSIDEAAGYNIALLQLVDYIKEVTGMEKENRFMDSFALLDKVSKLRIDLDMVAEKKNDIADFN